MVGDVMQKFIVHGPNGDRVTLTRAEAEHCVKELLRQLRMSRRDVLAVKAEEVKP